jgi:fluoride exporter
MRNKRKTIVWKELCWLAVAGAAGALSRYGLSGFVQWIAGEKFPWGTLAVNVVGCFAFGIIWTLADDRLIISGQTRIIILTGFMGSFTTFSTFAFETGALLRDSEWRDAALNLLTNNVVGILGVLLGMAVGRWF